MYRETAFTVKAGNWILLPKGIITHEFSEFADLISLNFSAHWPDGMDAILHEQVTIVPDQQTRDLLARTRVLLSTISLSYPHTQNGLPLQKSGFGNYLISNAHFFEWLEYFLPILPRFKAGIFIKKPDDPRLVTALFLIEEWDFKRPFDPHILANKVGLSLTQLNRISLKATHKTIFQHYSAVRLIQAKTLLNQGDLIIKEVAAALGFKQASHFTKWFKHQTGVLPGARKCFD